MTEHISKTAADKSQGTELGHRRLVPGIGLQQYARTFSDNLSFVTLPMSASVATLSLHSRSSVIPQELVTAEDIPPTGVAQREWLPAKGALALAFDERIQKDLANVL